MRDKIKDNFYLIKPYPKLLRTIYENQSVPKEYLSAFKEKSSEKYPMNLNSASELMDRDPIVQEDEPMQSQDAANSLEVEAEISPEKEPSQQPQVLDKSSSSSSGPSSKSLSYIIDDRDENNDSKSSSIPQ